MALDVESRNVTSVRSTDAVGPPNRRSKRFCGRVDPVQGPRGRRHLDKTSQQLRPPQGNIRRGVTHVQPSNPLRHAPRGRSKSRDVAETYEEGAEQIGQLDLAKSTCSGGWSVPKLAAWVSSSVARASSAIPSDRRQAYQATAAVTRGLGSPFDGPGSSTSSSAHTNGAFDH